MLVQRKNVRMCWKVIEMSHPYVERKGDSFQIINAIKKYQLTNKSDRVYTTESEDSTNLQETSVSVTY